MSGLLDRMEDYFASAEFTTPLGQFVASNVDEVEFVPLDEEQPMQNHAAFKRYTDTVEGLLEGFLDREGASAEALLDACREVEGSEAAAQYSCLDYLMAVSDYEQFMAVMYDFAAMQHGWGEGEGERGGQDDEEDSPGVSAAAEEKRGSDSVAGRVWNASSAEEVKSGK